MMLITVLISITFKKNTLCTNKIRVIYFCPSCVNFLPEKSAAPHRPPPRVPMYLKVFCFNLVRCEKSGFQE